MAATCLYGLLPALSVPQCPCMGQHTHRASLHILHPSESIQEEGRGTQQQNAACVHMSPTAPWVIAHSFTNLPPNAAVAAHQASSYSLLRTATKQWTHGYAGWVAWSHRAVMEQVSNDIRSRQAVHVHRQHVVATYPFLWGCMAATCFVCITHNEEPLTLHCFDRSLPQRSIKPIPCERGPGRHGISCLRHQKVWYWSYQYVKAGKKEM